MASPTKVIAKLEVKETAGMRRFLYPLEATLRGTYEGPRIRVAELDGTLVPSQAQSHSDDHCIQVHTLAFAISLAPNEARTLSVVETDEVPVIPDPITLTANQDGSCDASQARFAHRIDSAGRIVSVVYGGVQHLAGPATITLDGAEGIGVVRHKALIGDGLDSQLDYWGEYRAQEEPTDCQTSYHLTACKSWIHVRHNAFQTPEGGSVTFTLPTTIAGGATCDFGVGDGLYGKLQPGSIERIVWQMEVDHAVSWWIGSYGPASAVVRIDAQGDQKTRSGLETNGWFHLIGRDKALAMAFRCNYMECSRVIVDLNVDGVVRITFTARNVIRTVFDVYYHFLDDIPPIAAATNPASILCPPSVRVLPV